MADFDYTDALDMLMCITLQNKKNNYAKFKDFIHELRLTFDNSSNRSTGELKINLKEIMQIAKNNNDGICVSCTTILLNKLSEIDGTKEIYPIPSNVFWVINGNECN